MRIGELASATGLSTMTVRFYESIGLLPEPDRRPNGYRRYGPEAVDRLGFIKDARATGLTLAEIGLILDMKDEGESTCGHVIFMLEEHLDSLDRQMEELARTRERLVELTGRARSMDPSGCSDPNRCQTISKVEAEESQAVTS
jgi:MerR family transcriptional regulator, copper efflux regulator